MSTLRPNTEATAAHRSAIIAPTHASATALPQVRDLLPAGWRATSHQNLPGATHTIAVDPPTGTVDATAHLLPRVDEQRTAQHDWSVRIHNRTTRVDYPLYQAGGAHVAVFDTVEHAVAAAVTAIRIEAGTHGATTGTAPGTTA